MLDALCEAGQRDVEEQGGERGDQEEDYSDGEDAEDVDDNGRLREHEGGPGHVEEEQVEGGGPRGEGRAEEVPEYGEREEDVHNLKDLVVCTKLGKYGDDTQYSSWCLCWR